MTDRLTWAERNLLVLLDPLNTIPAGRWHFIRDGGSRYESGNGLHIFTFPRKRFLQYLLLKLFLRCCGRGKETVAVLKFQDGMTSTLFHAGNTLAYRAFVQSHATAGKTVRERIKGMLPAFINAELRYLAVGRDLVKLKAEMGNESPKFMFYSNESGKLILTAPHTFISGSGRLLVTTANKGYHPVLKKEFRLMELLGKASPGLVPEPADRISVNGRLLFEEEYIAGTTLRETLRNRRVATDGTMVADFIDRLDKWFAGYRNIFSGNKATLSELYRSSLEAFAVFHSSDARLEGFVLALTRCLAEIDSKHPGLVPVVAHNDLWPGNFIVSERRLTAIDWERATFDRPELFDYFWMLISAYLEYHIGKTGREDYSSSFRSFVEGGDLISDLVRDKLCLRLETNGFDRRDYDLFLALFLLEWSMQGQQALGRQTRMDRLALGELRHYLDIAGNRFDGGGADLHKTELQRAYANTAGG